MSDTPLLDIGSVPGEYAADIGAKLRAMLRLADLDTISDSDFLLALKPDNSLALIDPGDVPATRFAAGITPVEIVSSLPVTDNFAGRIVFLTTSKKLYRYDGSAWTAAVPAADVAGQLTDTQIADLSAAKLTGQVVAAQIANAAITVAKFAAGITPVEIVSALPSSGNSAGRTVMLTTDNKLYRYTGSAWTAAVTASDISGQLTDSQIAALAASKLTGQVVAAQIADAAVTVAKFAAGITPVEIVSALPSTGNFAGRTVILTTDKKLYRYDGTAFISSTAAADITGQLSDGQIAAIAAAKMTGQIVGTQITDGAISTAKLAAGSVTAAIIAAGAITAGKIAAGVITSTEIAAGTITAANIASDSITAGQIAAGAIGASELAAASVVAGKIAAGIITANEIAAATITGVKIAADTITAANILAGTITGTEIAAAAITGGHIAAGTVTAANIAADTITAGQIAVGAIGASEIAAGAITAGKIAAGAVTATEIAAVTITGAKIAAGTITAANILAGTITATEIAAAAITGAKIAANTITAANIAADTITAGQIAAGAIGASEIAANVITADKLTIGLRGVDMSGIEFSIAGNVLSWTAGAIQYTDDAGADASASISAGSVTWSTGKVYVFWSKAATTISTSTTYATAHAAGNVILAIYEGGDNFNMKYGRTVIAGSKIRTGSISADKLTVANLSAVSAVLGAVDISNAVIGTLTVGTINIANGAVTDAKSDQTAPGAPGTPALASVTVDFDKDGKLDTGLIGTWSAPGSGRVPKKYYIEIYRRKGDKGTDGNNVTGYTLWMTDTISAIAPLYYFAANGNYFHKMRVTPLSANDIAGTPSAYTSVGVNPSGKTAATAPSHVVVSPIKLGFVVSWDAPTDPDYFYSEIVTSNSPTFNTFAVQMSSQTTLNGLFSPDLGSYYIGVRHIDNSRNYSAITPAIVNVPYTADLVSGAFIENSTISKRHLDTASVDTPQLVDGSVQYAKLAANVFATGIAAMLSNGLGTYAFLKNNSGNLLGYGSTTSGANLSPSDSVGSSGSSPSGTWMCMGRCANGASTSFLKISNT